MYPFVMNYVHNKTTSTFYSNYESDVLLQTGRAQVYNVNEARWCSSFVRIMFDGGSLRSYITINLSYLLYDKNSS